MLLVTKSIEIGRQKRRYWQPKALLLPPPPSPRKGECRNTFWKILKGRKSWCFYLVVMNKSINFATIFSEFETITKEQNNKTFMKKKPITLNESVLNIPLEGNLNTEASTKLIESLNRYKDEEVEKVVFDATNLNYIASTGIRAVLFTAQMFDNEPTLEIIGANADVKKVFDMTGISSFIEFK